VEGREAKSRARRRTPVGRARRWAGRSLLHSVGGVDRAILDFHPLTGAQTIAAALVETLDAAVVHAHFDTAHSHIAVQW